MWMTFFQNFQASSEDLIWFFYHNRLSCVSFEYKGTSWHCTKNVIWSHLLEKSLMENFISFCAMSVLLKVYNFLDTLDTNASFQNWVKSVQIRRFFWSMLYCIRTEYEDLWSKSPYSVRIQVNTDQEKLCIWTLFTQCKAQMFQKFVKPLFY